MAKDPYRFLLRLPEPLRVRLVDAAARSGRSLNGEIVHRLERSLDPLAPLRRRGRGAGRLAVAFAVLAGTGFAFGHQVLGHVL